MLSSLNRRSIGVHASLVLSSVHEANPLCPTQDNQSPRYNQVANNTLMFTYHSYFDVEYAKTQSTDICSVSTKKFDNK